MIAYVTRWFVFGLALITAGVVLFYLTLQRSEFPEDCQRAFNASEAGDRDLAIDYFTSCISGGDLSAENLAVSHNDRGLAYYDKGDHDRAIQDYTEAIRLNPVLSVAHSNRGNTYSDKGDYDEAIRNYDEAIRINPDYDLAYNNRGWAYHQRGDYDQAIRDYNEAIRINPEDANAYNNRGLAYAEKSDFDRAIEDYDEAIQLNPNFADAYNNRCWDNAQMRRAVDALPDCDKALNLLPDEPAFLESRALVYWLLEDHNKARRDLERAHQINSSFPAWEARFLEFEEMF